MGICDDFELSKRASNLCNAMHRSYGVTLEDMDRGVPYVLHLTKDINPILESGTPNHMLENNEVYSKAIEIAEKAEDKDRARLNRNKFPNKSFQFSSVFSAALAAEKLRIPWVIDDADKTTAADRDLFIKVNKDVKRIIGYVRAGKYDAYGSTYEMKLAHALMFYIAKNEDGLNVKYDLAQNSPERSLVEVVDGKLAICSEFACLYLFVARQAGLKADPVQIFENEYGMAVDHVGVGVSTEEGDVVFDLSRDKSDFKVKNSRWCFIPKQDLMAYVLTNAAQDEAPNERVTIGLDKTDLLALALELAPKNYIVLKKQGRSLAADGSFDAAIAFFSAARELNPYAPDIYRSLGAVYAAAGQKKPSKAACEKYLKLGGVGDCPSK